MRVRDLSNVASKPPRRRKSAVLNKDSPESSNISADPSTSSVSTKKRETKTKTSRTCFAVGPETFPKPAVSSDVLPRNASEKSNKGGTHPNPKFPSNDREHWSLLSLIEVSPNSFYPNRRGFIPV